MYQRIEEITELDAQRINEFVDVVQTAKFAAETGDISAAESALVISDKASWLAVGLEFGWEDEYE